MSAALMRVTKLGRDGAGVWHARVTPQGGATVAVDRRYGSWRVTPDNGGGWRELVPTAAAELQARVRREERRA